MHALVSTLPAPFYAQVEALWQELEERHGLTGIKVTPYPHFSWQIAQEYDFGQMEAILTGLAADTPPIRVRTAGLGLFTGLQPVIFIPVVKTMELMRLHAEVWERSQVACQSCSPFYSPELWVPHISLAYDDVDTGNIAGAMAELGFRSFAWEMTIDNLALIYEPEGQTGQLKQRFRLGGKPKEKTK